MKEIQTTAYQTTNGKVFHNKHDALVYELNIVCHDIMVGGDIIDADALFEVLLNNADKLTPLLTELSK